VRKSVGASVSEPIAAIGNPPTQEANWNCRAQCPPERKKKISHQTQDREGGPEYLPFHALSLQPLSLLVSAGPGCRSREQRRRSTNACAYASGSAMTARPLARRSATRVRRVRPRGAEREKSGRGCGRTAKSTSSTGEAPAHVNGSLADTAGRPGLRFPSALWVAAGHHGSGVFPHDPRGHATLILYDGGLQRIGQLPTQLRGEP